VIVCVAVAGAANAQSAPKLERIAVIGCADCREAAQFAEIAAVAVTSSGTVWIADRENPRIRAFTSSGLPLRAFGRSGRGPGEFTGIEKLFPAVDGTISVVDMLQQRVTRIDSLGGFVGSTLIGGFPLDAGASSESSPIHVLLSRFQPGTSTVSRLDPASGTWRTVLGPLNDFPRADTPSEVHSLALAPDGTIAVSEGNAEYRIRVLAPGGASRDITRSVPHKLRTPAEIAALRSRVARAGALRAAELPKSGGDAGRGAPAVPAEKPHLPWLALQYDPSGRLWARTMRGDETRTIFDVFDKALAFLGEVSVAGDVTSYSLAGEFLATASVNTDGIPQVTVWRVRQ
jgi:hypothetical protein